MSHLHKLCTNFAPYKMYILHFAQLCANANIYRYFALAQNVINLHMLKS